jgi:hypothetical protein
MSKANSSKTDKNIVLCDNVGSTFTEIESERCLKIEIVELEIVELEIQVTNK